tara:strand:- start:7986 stop:9482 length:1497 start_codon:yes stop_codon:yes gene_type:complete
MVFGRFTRFRPEETEFGPRDPVTAEELRELESFLTNQQIIDNLDSGTEINATLLTLLEAIVDKQETDEAKKMQFSETIKEIRDFKAPISPEETEKALEQFQIQAIKAYQRIASSVVSIIEGELSALTTGVPGAFSFDEDDATEDMRRREINLFGGGSTTTQTTRFLEAYRQQIDDSVVAIQFLTTEIDLVRQLLEQASNDVVEIVDLQSSFAMSGQVVNLMQATEGYLKILTDSDGLDDSLRMFRSSLDAIDDCIEGNADGVRERSFGSGVLQGMISFSKFACKFAEAEGDLNKINQVDGAGVVRRALSRSFNDIMVLDQKFYPMNNQIPLPPITVSAVVINAYLESYENRARAMVTASENQLNQINNRFDREIANAQRNINQLSETLLLPKPAARSSISREQVVDAIETPEAFYMRTAGIPTRDRLERDLAGRRSRNRELATQYAVELGARPAARARIAAQSPAPLPPPPPPTRDMLERAGSRAMMANPRKKRRRKK